MIGIVFPLRCTKIHFWAGGSQLNCPWGTLHFPRCSGSIHGSKRMASFQMEKPRGFAASEFLLSPNSDPSGGPGPLGGPAHRPRVRRRRSRAPEPLRGEPRIRGLGGRHAGPGRVGSLGGAQHGGKKEVLLLVLFMWAILVQFALANVGRIHIAWHMLAKVFFCF